jgi:hypothetical protein
MHLRRASYQRAESALRAVRSGPMPARRTIRSIKLAWCAMSANMLALRQKSLTGQSSCGPPMLPQADICRLPRTRDRHMPGAQHPAARMPQSQVPSGLAAHRQRGRIRGLVRDGSLWRHQALQNPVGWSSTDRGLAVPRRFSSLTIQSGIPLRSRDRDGSSALLLRARLL